MKMIAFACDHLAVDLKKELMEYVGSLGYECRDYGANSTERVDYPDYALAAADAVVSGECDRGILICGTGVGIGIAANKVKGIRCVTCSDCYSAKMSREHNDANMISIGARVVGNELAKMIIKAWLDAEFEGGRHQVRVDKIMSIERTGKI
ncbi:MAG: ribose 5-phosphate isomerase B [Oscillospiraceae bacterium]|nr:ribose 5-phosphate isomerase B [Oscillospiraceae bacterium]